VIWWLWASGAGDSRSRGRSDLIFYPQLADETEAIAIGQQCPGLEYGCVVEVRPMAERCTVRARALAGIGQLAGDAGLISQSD